MLPVNQTSVLGSLSATLFVQNITFIVHVPLKGFYSPYLVENLCSRTSLITRYSVFSPGEVYQVIWHLSNNIFHTLFNHIFCENFVLFFRIFYKGIISQ